MPEADHITPAPEADCGWLTKEELAKEEYKERKLLRERELERIRNFGKGRIPVGFTRTQYLRLLAEVKARNELDDNSQLPE